MTNANNGATQIVAGNVRAFSARSRLTHSELAARVTDSGVPMQVHTIRSIVSGRRHAITVDEMCAFADAFSVQPVDMLA